MIKELKKFKTVFENSIYTTYFVFLTQLSYAAILSTAYALIMMIVIVGLLKEAVEAKWCSVTTFFLLFVSLSFVISALLHPQVRPCTCLIYIEFDPSVS